MHAVLMYPHVLTCWMCHMFLVSIARIWVCHENNFLQFENIDWIFTIIRNGSMIWSIDQSYSCIYCTFAIGISIQIFYLNYLVFAHYKSNLTNTNPQIILFIVSLLSINSIVCWKCAIPMRQLYLLLSQFYKYMYVCMWESELNLCRHTSSMQFFFYLNMCTCWIRSVQNRVSKFLRTEGRKWNERRRKEEKKNLWECSWGKTRTGGEYDITCIAIIVWKIRYFKILLNNIVYTGFMS